MISKSLQASLAEALRAARENRHEYLCVEHLLHALCHDHYGREIILSCGGNPDELRKDLDQFFLDHMTFVPESVQHVPQQTLAFERLLQRAIGHVHHAGKKEVDAGDILAALFEEEDSHAAYCLAKQNVTRLDVLDYISHGIGKMDNAADDAEDLDEFPGEETGDEPAEDRKRKRSRDPLQAFCVNLNERAANGRIDPLIGRQYELRRVGQVLSRRRKNNPVLVGEPGVGKTAIVEGLARAIHLGEAAPALGDIEILQLDLAGMLAGTKFRGEFEARLKAVIAAVVEKPNVVLFIDEIHQMVGAGATTDSSVDASNILKPVLASGEVRCIGSTTYTEYRNLFEKDHALSRRFQKIDVEEPSAEETLRILRGLKPHYEQHHGIRYTDTALQAAAELAAKHINDRFLPDKAIDVLDEAGATMRLDNRPRKTIRPGDIERVVADIARVPVRSVASSEKERLSHLEDDLKRVVFGQDPALHAVATAIKRSRAGLGRAEQPVGSFLFTGPTGVGKTEVARQLAQNLGVHFARYDMSEYMEKHTVSRLIGAPPGYVGFDQGGLLTDEIRKHPHCVLLLDEIEKAHPDLFNVLLQVMDHATLTDNTGKKADFRNVVLIMTSNAGAREMSANAIGFGRGHEAVTGKSLKAVEKAFSPEFRNRLDAVVAFSPLTPETMGRIVDKFVAELQAMLLTRKVTLELSPEAHAWFREHGFDEKFGARPLHRLLQAEVKDKLSDAVLFGALENGGHVIVKVVDDEVTLDCTPRD